MLQATSCLWVAFVLAGYSDRECELFGRFFLFHNVAVFVLSFGSSSEVSFYSDFASGPLSTAFPSAAP